MSQADAAAVDAATPKRPTLLAIGANPDSFGHLCLTISRQLASSGAYKKSTNRIEFTAAASDDTQRNEHLLSIETKYYETQLSVQFVPHADDFVAAAQVDRLFDAHQIEALLVFEGLPHASTLLKHLNASDANVLKILLMSSRSGELGDNEALEDFVTIKLDMSEDDKVAEKPHDETDEEEDEEEYSELDELINTIFVHPWQSMKMKNETASSSRPFHAFTAAATSATTSAKKEGEDKNGKSENDGDGDDDVDDDADEDEAAVSLGFEDLMMNLHDIRSKANEMTFEERKKYAENVVMNFWRSMGGDEDEINGLDDDNNDNS